MVMREYHFQLLSEILAFLRHPTDEAITGLTRSLILRRILVLISWLYVVVIPIALLITVLLTLLKYEGINAVSEFAINGNLLMIFLLGGVVAPFIEETTFRLPLRFKPFYLGLATFFAARIISVFINRVYFPESNLTLQVWFIPLLLSLSVYAILRRPDIKDRLNNFYASHFGGIFYILTILFGMMHITNYSEVRNILLVVVLLGLPQVIVGLVLGFIRLRHGFWYGFLMHGMYNTFLLLPASLARYEDNQLLMTVAGIIGLCIFSFFGYGLVTLVYNVYRFISHK